MGGAEPRGLARGAAAHWTVGGPGAEAAGGPEQARPGPGRAPRESNKGLCAGRVGQIGIARRPWPRRDAPLPPPPAAWTAPSGTPTDNPPAPATLRGRPGRRSAAEGAPVHGGARAPAAFSTRIPMRTTCPAMPPSPPNIPLAISAFPSLAGIAAAGGRAPRCMPHAGWARTIQRCGCRGRVRREGWEGGRRNRGRGGGRAAWRGGHGPPAPPPRCKKSAARWLGPGGGGPFNVPNVRDVRAAAVQPPAFRHAPAPWFAARAAAPNSCH